MDVKIKGNSIYQLCRREIEKQDFRCNQSLSSSSSLLASLPSIWKVDQVIVSFRVEWIWSLICHAEPKDDECECRKECSTEATNVSSAQSMWMFMTQLLEDEHDQHHSQQNNSNELLARR
jgi:hypothetical protein